MAERLYKTCFEDFADLFAWKISEKLRSDESVDG
jgi:hypothetical protein